MWEHCEYYQVIALKLNNLIEAVVTDFSLMYQIISRYHMHSWVTSFAWVRDRIYRSSS